MSKESLFELHKVSKRFVTGTHARDALHPINLVLLHGEALAIVGESGSGKSTLAKIMIGLIAPSSGSIFFEGQPLTLPRHLQFKKKTQMIFQDPLASLNPTFSVEDTLMEPLQRYRLHIGKQAYRLGELLEQVGLCWADRVKRPHELSGGEAQRVAIARALAVEPQCLLCDEPFSSLDLLTQSQVVQVLKDLRRQHGLTYVLISHNLSLVYELTEKVLVLKQGECVEATETPLLFQRPTHPYTKRLLQSIPSPCFSKTEKTISPQ